MNILNLDAGIGGNRKLWSGHEITAVEIIPEIAEIYKKLYSDDKVIVGDSNQFLQENFNKFDFIWGSPPCPTHGQYRHNIGVKAKGYTPVIPDMTTLYGRIVFLETYFKGKYVIENVKPYYQPLIQPRFKLQRHLFWANFDVPEKKFTPAKIRSKNKISDFDEYEIIKNSKIKNKRQVLRNQCLPEIGRYIISFI